jgi:hypothetical protein
MKFLIAILIWAVLGGASIKAEEFDAKKFVYSYFSALTASQSPEATSKDIEHYLSFLAENVGHQHIPYDSDDTRHPDGKSQMRKGMGLYLGLHTQYKGTLVTVTYGHGVVALQYDTLAKGVHPQTKEEMLLKYRTLEILEIENGKVSVIRKYSE